MTPETMLIRCPNCQSVWGIEEIDWQECDCCGWPDNEEENIDNDNDFDWEDWEEDTNPNDSRKL